MRQSRPWFRGHLWIVATGATAALVFAATFLAVGAVADGGENLVEASRVTVAPTPPGVSAENVSAPDRDPPSPLLDQGLLADPETRPPAQESLPPPEESLTAIVEPQRTLPVFDESELTFGGSGEEGAILAGTGIVPSSKAEYETNWEMLVPSAQIRASIVQVGRVGQNGFGAPDNPQVIGWWMFGPAPGEVGNVLLNGHRDFTDIDGNIGTGVCWLLPQTELGDFVIIRDVDAEQSYVYTVTEVASVLWNAPEGVEYLQPSDDAILTLITCEGSFDTDSFNYSNRRIVVAELTDVVPFATS